MDRNRIQALASLIPDDDDYFVQASKDYDDLGSVQESAILKFIIPYSDLKFGWNFIKFLIRKNMPPPNFKEPYLLRAYNFEKFGQFDEAVVQAITFDHPSQKFYSDMLQSFLLVENITFEQIAQKTGIGIDTIKAYEQLFFNILDRSKESAFLAQHVYPETRYVEMFDNYIENESFGMLLKRAGYNNGMDPIEFFSGLRTPILTNGDMSNASVKMENALMINGFMLATNGFINQKSAGVSHAKTIIAAEKQGGGMTGAEDELGIGSLGSSIMDELNKYSDNITRKRLTASKKLLDHKTEE